MQKSCTDEQEWTTGIVTFHAEIRLQESRKERKSHFRLQGNQKMERKSHTDILIYRYTDILIYTKNPCHWMILFCHPLFSCSPSIQERSSLPFSSLYRHIEGTIDVDLHHVPRRKWLVSLADSSCTNTSLSGCFISSVSHLQVTVASLISFRISSDFFYVHLVMYTELVSFHDSLRRSTPFLQRYLRRLNSFTVLLLMHSCRSHLFVHNHQWDSSLIMVFSLQFLPFCAVLLPSDWSRFRVFYCCSLLLSSWSYNSAYRAMCPIRLLLTRFNARNEGKRSRTQRCSCIQKALRALRINAGIPAVAFLRS